MTTNYCNTFIEVAADCPVDTAEVRYAAHGERRGLSREEFFSKGQPCFRSSPLTRRYGWGVHCDEKGLIAIYAVDSRQYARLAGDDTLKHLKAMRARRA